MSDFIVSVGQHVLDVAKNDPDHRAFVREAMGQLRPFLRLMSGHAQLQNDTAAAAAIIETLGKQAVPPMDVVLRDSAVKFVPMREMRRLPARLEDYVFPAVDLLGDDIMHFLMVHGMKTMQQTHAFVVKNTAQAVPTLFRHHENLLQRHLTGT
jgi:hypothetical protein